MPAQPPRDEREPVERRDIAKVQIVDGDQRRRRGGEPSRQLEQRVIALRRLDQAAGDGKREVAFAGLTPAASTVSRCAVARARARSRSAVLPLPGGPANRTRPPHPARAIRIARSMVASSAARSKSRSDTQHQWRVTAWSDPTLRAGPLHRAFDRSGAAPAPYGLEPPGVCAGRLPRYFFADLEDRGPCSATRHRAFRRGSPARPESRRSRPKSSDSLSVTSYLALLSATRSRRRGSSTSTSRRLFFEVKRKMWPPARLAVAAPTNRSPSYSRPSSRVDEADPARRDREPPG